MDLGAMAMKGYYTFPNAPASLEPHHKIIYPGHSLLGGGESYSSAEKQSVYSKVPPDWATLSRAICIKMNKSVMPFCVQIIRIQKQHLKPYSWFYIFSISLLVWVLWHINLCRLFNAEYIFIQINGPISNNLMSTQFNCQKHFDFKLFSLVKQF